MLKFFLFLISIYAALLLFLYWNQRQLIYFPNSSLPSPTDSGVAEMQIVILETDDGLDLTAWYHPPLNQQQPTIVYLHGNAGNIGYRGPIIKPFLNHGYGVLLVTYRGYSGNAGLPHEEGFYKDARAALSFLQHNHVPNSCIVLYGESIGCAVAAQMATEYPVGALILQAPFTSLVAIGQFHYPFFPINWLLKDRFDSIGKANQIEAPTLILYGQNDTIVPPRFSIELFDALHSPKHLEAIPNRGHNDIFSPRLAMDFIKKHVKCNQK